MTAAAEGEWEWEAVGNVADGVAGGRCHLLVYLVRVQSYSYLYRTGTRTVLIASSYSYPLVLVKRAQDTVALSAISGAA